MDRASYYEEMKRLAHEVRQQYGVTTSKVGLKLIRWIYKEEGIELDYWRPKLRKVRAAYFIVDGAPCVLLNAGIKPKEPRIFALCHELKHLENRIEAGTEAPSREMSMVRAERAMPQTKLIKEAVERPFDALDRGEILVNHRFRGTRETAPHTGLYEPEQELVSLSGVKPAAALVDVADDNRNCEAAEEHLVVVEPEAAADHVETRLDRPSRALKSVLHLLSVLIVKVCELGFTSEDGVDAAEQPVEVEVVPALRPFLEELFHGFAPFRPFGTDLSESQVTLRELGAAAVDAVENVHNDVEGFVRASDFFAVQLDIGDAEQFAEAADVFSHPGGERRILAQLRDEIAEACRPFLH